MQSQEPVKEKENASVLTEKVLHSAWTEWIYRDQAVNEVDKWVLPFREISPKRPWLKAAREASFISVREMAKRMRIRSSSYEKFERQEEEKKISLLRLERCAEALDCELVYAIRPRNGQTFTRRNWQTLLKEVEKHPFLPKAVPQQRGVFLARLIREKRRDPVFCRKNGWAFERGTDSNARTVWD